MSNRIKSFLTGHRNKIISGAVILAVLAVFFFIDGGTEQKEFTNELAYTTETVLPETPTETITPLPTDAIADAPTELPAQSHVQETPKPQVTEKSIKATEIPTQAPTPVPQTASPTESPTDNELTCTLSVTCGTILNNLSRFDSNKSDIVPQDGVIYPEKTVVFYEGESVFNILFREMKQNKIHFEFVNTPIYNSVYIEGIANIYEFDCGELSGWMYKVNGWYPNYGCSQYTVKNGDKIEFVYTCDLGKDVGGEYSPRNGR